jgi:hypothetical protein
MDEIVAQESWSIEQVAFIENSLLKGIMNCRTYEAVEAAISYGAFINTVGLTPENYSVFLKMLDIENHWVIDSLIGDKDPFLLLSPVQPNQYIVGKIFGMMTRWHKGGIYPKNLSVILGVLQSNYSSPRDGYRIYPISIADLNALGKHLDKEKGQEDALNRTILNILDKIADLEGVGTNPDMEEVAIHSSNIRNGFFDDRKRMEDIIPPVLLVKASYHEKEVAPRKKVTIREKLKKEKEQGKSAEKTK